MSIVPRLADPVSETPRVAPFHELAVHRAYLGVFADPEAEGFEDLASALAPLAKRNGLQIVLFPQGGRSDEAVKARLRAIDWKIPFVLAHLTQPYTRILAGAEVALPWIQLNSPEGRVLFQAPWKPGVLEDLVPVVDAAVGSAPPVTGTPP
jgi:hypothetical protein